MKKNFSARRVISHLLLMICSVSIGLGASEVWARARYKDAYPLGLSMSWFNHMDRFVIEPEFGFRPVFGNRPYSEYGTKANSYTLLKKQGIKRILFMGDSVTARGKIIKELKKRYGDRFEYWNAGVESYNTIQEVNYYKKFNHRINPDHVVLTFHNNDFTDTPIIIKKPTGEYSVYSPSFPIKYVNSFLYRYSVLYRVFIAHTMNTGKLMENEVRESLRELKTLLDRQNVPLTVLICPVFKDRDRWTDSEKESRRVSIQIFKQLNIRYYDLADVMFKNFDPKIFSGDLMHPDDRIASLFADYLTENGLLDLLSGD